MFAAAQSFVHRDRLGSIQTESPTKWNSVSHRCCLLSRIPRQRNLETFHEENLHRRLSTCPSGVFPRQTTFADESRSEPSTIDHDQSCLKSKRARKKLVFVFRFLLADVLLFHAQYKMTSRKDSLELDYFFTRLNCNELLRLKRPLAKRETIIVTRLVSLSVKGKNEWMNQMDTFFIHRRLVLLWYRCFVLMKCESSRTRDSFTVSLSEPTRKAAVLLSLSRSRLTSPMLFFLSSFIIQVVLIGMIHLIDARYLRVEFGLLLHILSSISLLFISF